MSSEINDSTNDVGVRVRRAVADLSETERIAMILRHGPWDGVQRTLEEVAEQLGMAPEDVSHIEQKLITRIRGEGSLEGQNDDLWDEDDELEDDEDDSRSEPRLVFSAQEPQQPYMSIEELEEGYGDDSDGPDYDGYTAQERELREIGGVVGMSMEIGDAEMPEAGDEDDNDAFGGWEVDDHDFS